MYSKQIKSLSEHFTDVLRENGKTPCVLDEVAPMTPAQKAAADKAKKNLKNGDTVISTSGENLKFVSKAGNRSTVRDNTGKTKQIDNDDLVVSTDEKPEVDESIKKLKTLAGL